MATDAFKQWCIIELFGHTRVAGLLTEARWPPGFAQLEIPGDDKHPATTHFYNPQSFFGLHPVTEEIARKVCENCRPEVVHPWEMPSQPRLPAKAENNDTDCDTDGEECSRCGNHPKSGDELYACRKCDALVCSECSENAIDNYSDVLCLPCFGHEDDDAAVPYRPSVTPACVQCGKPVEPERKVYAQPTCFACLPPPAPLPEPPLPQQQRDAQRAGDATHRCKICGALWRHSPPAWSLVVGTPAGNCCAVPGLSTNLEPVMVIKNVDIKIVMAPEIPIVPRGTDPCPTCHGTGRAADSGRCHDCNGRGYDLPF